MEQIEPGGEGQRLAALWEQHSRRVLAYALRHVDPDTAQEVLSETFLVAWRRLADVPGAPLPWLLVVARDTIANQRRSTYRRAVVHRELVHTSWSTWSASPRARQPPTWTRSSVTRCCARWPPWATASARPCCSPPGTG